MTGQSHRRDCDRHCPQSQSVVLARLHATSKCRSVHRQRQSRAPRIAVVSDGSVAGAHLPKGNNLDQLRIGVATDCCHILIKFGMRQLPFQTDATTIPTCVVPETAFLSRSQNPMSSENTPTKETSPRSRSSMAFSVEFCHPGE